VARSGIAAAAARARKTRMTAVVPSVAVLSKPEVADAGPPTRAGKRHRHTHALSSCDHWAAPTTRKTALAAAIEARLAVACRFLAVANSAPSPAGAASGKPARPASARRAMIPPRATSRARSTDRGRSSMSAMSSSANSSP
jgi:hypothetical protein